MQQLNGRVAVVTGAASGIGLAMTRAFVGAGMSVVMADVDERALVEQARTLEADGARVVGVLTDVTVPAEVESLADKAEAAFGTVHLVCNNAGVAPAGPLLASTADEMRWVFDVNVHGVANGIRTFGPRLVAAGEGHIVNTASEAGLTTTSMLAVYCASKHAVVGLSEALFWGARGHRGRGELPLPGTRTHRHLRVRAQQAGAPGTRCGPRVHDSPLREMIQVIGMDPSEVAATVVDAVLHDRFWVFTHDVTPKRAAVRCADIAAGRNPTSPHSA